MKDEDNIVFHQESIDNMDKKIVDPDFLSGMLSFLRSGLKYEINEVYRLVKKDL